MLEKAEEHSVRCPEETSESEPLITCCKARGDVENGIETWHVQARVGGCPLIAQPASGMKVGNNFVRRGKGRVPCTPQTPA